MPLVEQYSIDFCTVLLNPSMFQDRKSHAYIIAKTEMDLQFARSVLEPRLLEELNMAADDQKLLFLNAAQHADPEIISRVNTSPRLRELTQQHDINFLELDLSVAIRKSSSAPQSQRTPKSPFNDFAGFHRTLNQSAKAKLPLFYDINRVREAMRVLRLTLLRMIEHSPKAKKVFYMDLVNQLYQWDTRLGRDKGLTAEYLLSQLAYSVLQEQAELYDCLIQRLDQVNTLIEKVLTCAQAYLALLQPNTVQYLELDSTASRSSDAMHEYYAREAHIVEIVTTFKVIIEGFLDKMTASESSTDSQGHLYKTAVSHALSIPLTKRSSLTASSDSTEVEDETQSTSNASDDSTKAETHSNSNQGSRLSLSSTDDAVDLDQMNTDINIAHNLSMPLTENLIKHTPALEEHRSARRLVKDLRHVSLLSAAWTLVLTLIYEEELQSHPTHNRRIQHTQTP